MDLEQLVDHLSRPEAYSHPAHDFEIVHTHISVVFLAGDYAYKVKKPVDFGFLDFTTLAKRRRFCDEEVRLNRRLAPDVYVEVVPIGRDGDRLVFGGSGETVEWAVKMRRLPAESTLAEHLARGTLSAEMVAAVARRIAAFHASAASGPEVSRWGRWQTVAGNARENFEQITPNVGHTVSRAVYDRLRARTESDLERLRPIIEDRAARHVPRDTHGDLHLQHVYSFPHASPPGDLVVVDCIEFNERFRFADPVADAAFLVMDLRYRGRPDLATVFAEAYLGAADDEEGRALLPFYTAYRAVVRGKVDGFALADPDIPEAQRESTMHRARPYFTLALGSLVPASERPGLILSTGLPGTGKTWMAQWLAEAHGATVVSTDRVRKDLAGLSAMDDASAPVDQGIYTAEMSDRTYEACVRRADDLLFEGQRVVVDGTFREERRRRDFLDLARQWRVPLVILECKADPATVRARLQARDRDASDADWAVHQALAERWEPYGEGEETAEAAHVIDTARPDDESRAAARDALAAAGLA